MRGGALKERNAQQKVRFAGPASNPPAKIDACMEAKLEAAMQRVKQDLLAELGTQNRSLVERVSELEKENAMLRRVSARDGKGLDDRRVPFEQPRQMDDMALGRLRPSQVRPFRGSKGSATPDVPYEHSKFAQDVARMCAVILPDGVNSDSSSVSCGETGSPSPGSTASEASPFVEPLPRRSRSLTSIVARSGSAEPEHPVRVLTRGQSRQVLSSPSDAPLLYASLQRAVSQELGEPRTVSARSLRVRCPEQPEAVRGAPYTDRPRLARDRHTAPLPSPPPPPPTPFMSPRGTARVPRPAALGYPPLGHAVLPYHASLGAMRMPVVTRLR